MATFNDLNEAVMAHDRARVRRLVSRGIEVNCRDSKKRTVLHHAAGHFGGDAVRDDIRNLIKLGADINAVDIDEKTPLHYALSEEAVDYIAFSTYEKLAKKKKQFNRELQDKIALETVYRQQIEAVRYLVGLGANINAKCYHRVTSIHRAIRLKNVQGLQILVRLGVDVNAKRFAKCTVIHLAGVSTQKLLKCLAELGADCNSSCSVSRPLYEAVELGRLDVIKILVENDVNIHTEMIYNYTPIMYALDNKSVDTIECLAKLGADINSKMSITTVVHETVKTGRVDIMEYLVKKGADTSGMAAGVTALGMAVGRDLRELMNILLKVGADVNVRYDVGISPLVVAMRLKDTEMVKALVRLGAKIDEAVILENTTVLYQAVGGDPQIVKLLLQHGGDVNLRYNRSVLPIHDVVARGDCQMLRVWAELGANMNSWKMEGLGLLDVLMEDVAQDYMAMTEVLVEAGFDLNKGHNRNVTALHDAVRLGDREMVQTLGDLKADMNSSKTEGNTSLSIASMADKTDAIRYLVQKEANIIMELTMGVTPLHDAVREKNVEMAHVLLKSGATCAKSVKHKVSALNHAILYGNKDTVECLLDCHADVNKKTSTNISPLHDAVENSDLAMVRALTSFGYEGTKDKVDEVIPIDDSILHDCLEITETLLKHGADTNCLQNIRITPLDAALKQNDPSCESLLVSRGEKAKMDSVGSSPLHTACNHGHTDHARLLIIAGCDVDKCDYYGDKPLELLPLAKVIDYHVLQEATTTEKITEQVPTGFVCVSDCEDMMTSLNTPGIGDVHYITTPSSTEISVRVNQLLEITTRNCKAFSGRTLKPIGSAAEGTKVGLPNEMDFLFEFPLSKDEESHIAEFGYGYMKYNYLIESLVRLKSALQKRGISGPTLSSILQRGYGSAGFHTYFKEEVMNDIFIHLPDSVSDDKVSVRPKGSVHVKDSDRKANSKLLLMWDDGNTSFHISVDIVPSLHIDNWPEGAITSTWLMDQQQLRSRGYVLVAKPPHVKSDLAKKCTAHELKTLWKISFPHLETEHMQRLEQRVKDVYLTAKCLRNPDVCRIMVTDNGSFPRNVDKYVTSYLLKMCFFKNVEHFRQQDMCLEEMVCKVYDELEQGLSKAFIPLFFLPNVSALDGIKLDVAKSAKVAKIMAQFARALYQRTCQRADRDITDKDDATVHPRSVYRVYNISQEE